MLCETRDSGQRVIVRILYLIKIQIAAIFAAYSLSTHRILRSFERILLPLVLRGLHGRAIGAGKAGTFASICAVLHPTLTKS